MMKNKLRTLLAFIAGNKFELAMIAVAVVAAIMLAVVYALLWRLYFPA